MAVDFELFRPELETALAYADGAKGGRPPFDPVMMFKILVIQAQNSSLRRAGRVPDQRPPVVHAVSRLVLGERDDATTIWLFDVPRSARERLVKAGAIKRLFDRFDQAVRDAGYIAMGGQIVDASLVAAPKQRNTEDEKADIKAGRIPEAWKKKPAKLRQKDREPRCGLLAASPPEIG